MDFGYSFFFSSQINDTVEHKRNQIKGIEDFNTNVATINLYYDEVIKKIDATDLGCGLSCKEKIETLKSIQENFEDENTNKMTAIESSANQISDYVNNFDVKQIEDQVLNS